MTNRAFKTGESREQASLLPARIEDYVAADNPVRAIDSFVGALDLAKLGFRHANRGVEMGQPPYDPADLLKLYLYGYINQVRSSRRLEREASRNLELIWLLKNLRPGYRTIANFRKENWKALKAVNRGFVLLLRELVLERHRARMESASNLMRRRSAIVEHPFGTLKCRAGYRHFLVRGFDKVRGEWSLMALCYNFTRVLNILGFEGFAACMAKVFRSLARALTAASSCIRDLLEALGANVPVWLSIKRFGLSPVA
jgi:transposase